MNDTATAPLQTKKNSILVYFLASPEDEVECIGIRKYLSPVIRNSSVPIDICSDFDAAPGDDKEKCKQKLYDADIVLAFISADFINNDDTYQRTQQVIEKYNRNEVIMLPILVRNCLWKSTPFVKLPLLPKNFQPLNNKQFWNSEDDALTAVVTDISDAINQFSAERNRTTSTNLFNNSYGPTFQTIDGKQPFVAADNTNNIANKPAQDTAPNKPTTPKPPVQENVPINVNWRKEYYRNVLKKRAAAYIIDNLITYLPVYVIAFSIASAFIVTPGTDYNGNPLPIPDDQLNEIIGIGFLASIVVSAAMEASRWRGTFGKQIMKLQITDREGHPISFKRALWRNFLKILIGYSYCFIIPLIIQYYTFKKTKQLFHDQLSYTVIGEKLKS